MSTPFHPGELRAQQLAGVTGAGHGIRDFMPGQHRDFFAALPFVLLASIGDDGAARAQVLCGAPGFIGSPDPHTLVVAAASTLAQGAPVGLLGIDFATRRRNRANGRVRSNDKGLLVIDVLQSFGNCPRHIRLRQVHAALRTPRPGRSFDGLDALARADTFFIATAGGAHGVDISHRGGPPGFVQVDGMTLQVPDFDGNRYFNTLGNLLIDPRAALLYIDFERGDVLHLQGEIAIDWHGGGERRWRFTASGGAWADASLPLRWSSPDVVAL